MLPGIIPRPYRLLFPDFPSFPQVPLTAASLNLSGHHSVYTDTNNKPPIGVYVGVCLPH